MESEVVDVPERHRFEMTVNRETCFVSYRVAGDRIVLTHAEVPQRLSGQGIGSRLAKGVYDLVRASGRKAVPACGFMAAWVDRHPDYRDVVDR